MERHAVHSSWFPWLRLGNTRRVSARGRIPLSKCWCIEFTLLRGNSHQTQACQSYLPGDPTLSTLAPKSLSSLQIRTCQPWVASPILGSAASFPLSQYASWLDNPFILLIVSVPTAVGHFFLT